MTTDLVNLIGEYSATDNLYKEPEKPEFPYLQIQPPFIFKIYFDGGGSYDFAYGSFEIEFNGFSVQRHRMPFRMYNVNGIKLSSNVAEYLSLICALKWLETVKEKKQYAIQIYGDSQIVVYQVSGKYRCKTPHLKVLADICRKHLNQFGDFRIYWHPRQNNVERFGH